MQKIASPQELTVELRRLLAYCSGPEKPSRVRLASELRELAARVAGFPRSSATYQEYVERKKREGEKPLDKKEWEARTQGGEKAEKGKGKKDDGDESDPKPFADGRTLNQAGASIPEQLWHTVRTKLKDVENYQEFQHNLREKSSDWQADTEKFVKEQGETLKKVTKEVASELDQMEDRIGKLFKAYHREVPKHIQTAVEAVRKLTPELEDAYKEWSQKAVETATEMFDDDERGAHKKMDAKRRELTKGLLAITEEIRKYKKAS